MNCNLCGKEFDKRDLIMKKADNGTEYGICKNCEENGTELIHTRAYYICAKCGYPHRRDELKRMCKFCGQSRDFEKLELTSVEEELLDTEPEKLYEEKLDREVWEKISDWRESSGYDEVKIRHKRDRLIDTASLVGLLLTFFLLEYNRGKFSGQKWLCLGLMVPAVLILISSPVFKKIDKKPRKKYFPIWSIYAVMAFLVAVYILIIKLFS